MTSCKFLVFFVSSEAVYLISYYNGRGFSLVFQFFPMHVGDEVVNNVLSAILTACTVICVAATLILWIIFGVQDTASCKYI